MSSILQDTDPINYSDSFKVWIDRFNEIVSELKTTNFAIDDEYVNVDLAQSITGAKTFNNATVFNANVSISGNLNQSGLIVTNVANQELTFKYGIDGNINFIGVNGINLLANSTASEFSLSFSTENTLILDYAIPGGTFKIADNVNLEVENSQIKFGSDTWNFPNLPISPSVLTVDGEVISWTSSNDFVSSIADDLANTIALTNATEIMPVGTIIEVDTTKAEEWGEGDFTGIEYGHIPDDTKFYGWLILNGETINITDDSRFSDIIAILNPTPGATSADLLPNSTSGSPANVKFIKFLPDAVATFGLTRGNGISFFDSDNILRTNSTLKNGFTRVELNVDTDVFDFDVNGKLQIKSNIPRYTNNRLTTATPASPTDATNKAYVDNRVSLGGVEGSCFDLMESSDGLGYRDAKNSFSIVDKSGAGRAWRTAATSTLGESSVDADVTLNSISPFGVNFGKVTQLQRTFATPDQFFFVDEDDVIYGYGANTSGAIGASNRGVTEFSSYYNSGFFPANPYGGSTQIRQLLPAFLPIKELWPSNAVLVDKVSGISGSNDTDINITIKTNDGYDNDYVNTNNPLSGLVRYLNGSEPYTRGYYISTGRNIEGQFGNGLNTSTTPLTGPRVWGPGIDSPGRNLWYNFALTETQKTSIKTTGTLSGLLNTPSSREQIRKRFNWFKPNAIIDGGLQPLAVDALAEWRTQTGLSIESFLDYSWYIKKVVRTYDGHYVIVGKPGNESDNEVWCAGINRKGAFGNLSTGSISDFVPMLSDTTTPNAASVFRVLGGASSGSVFEKTDTSAHGLSDYDILTFGTTNRYVILGNASGENRSTQFRLFSSLTNARQAFISNSTTGVVTLNNTTTLSNGIGALNTHRSRLRGIVDISVSRGTGADTSGDGIILRQALSFTSPLPTDLLDRLPESNILTDRLIACGLNSNGRLAINNLDNPTIVRATAFTAPGPGANKIIKIQTCNFSAISFALSSNGVLYFAGNRASGCSNSGSAAAGNIVTWTSLNIPNVYDFFIIDDSSRTRVFVISQSTSGVFELYAGGINVGYILGTSRSLGAATPNFAKLIFPENPKNIVNIAGAMNQTYILCKDEGEDIGRVYVTGTEVSRSYFPVSTVTKTIPQFKKIDRDIL